MERSGFGIMAIIGIVVGAIIVIILFSGFSIGTLDTARNPFGPGEGPPKIIMTYEGEEYEGELRGYVYSSQETIAKLPDINLVNATEVSTDIVNVTKGSDIEFVVRGNPAPEAQFDSLAVSALTEDGRPVTVLDPKTPQNDTYTIDRLQEGQEYVLSAAATWTPEDRSERISGYVIYGYRISVVGTVQPAAEAKG